MYYRLLEFHAFFEEPYDICQEIFPQNSNAIFSKLWGYFAKMNINREQCSNSERLFRYIEENRDQYLQNNTMYLEYLNAILNK